MRFFAYSLTLLAILTSAANAQDPKKKANERPRLFNGALIKKFEDLQERLKKEREQRKKAREEDERKKAASNRPENDRLRNMRLDPDLLRKEFDRVKDSFLPGRPNELGSSSRRGNEPPNQMRIPPNGSGSGLLGPGNLSPQNAPTRPRVNAQSPTNDQPNVSLGVEVRPGGLTKSGLIVDTVARTSPAAVAGIRKNDRIISVGGSPIKKVEDLRLIMSAFEPGDRTEVELVRGGKKEKLLIDFPSDSKVNNSLALNPPAGGNAEELPLPNGARVPNNARVPEGKSNGLPPVLPLLGPQNQETSPTGANTEEFRSGIGVTAVAVDPTLFLREKLNVRQGAFLEDVEKDSAAAKAGLKAGDVVIAVDGRKVDSAVGMAELIQTYKPGETAQILYYRENRLKRSEIEMDAVPVSRFDQAAKPIREAQNLTNRDRENPSGKRNSIFSDLGKDFPRLRKVEEMIDRFSPDAKNNNTQTLPPVAGDPTRETELQNEVQTLRDRLRGQDRQIKDLTEKLTLIEKLLSEKKNQDSKSKK